MSEITRFMNTKYLLNILKNLNNLFRKIDIARQFPDILWILG